MLLSPDVQSIIPRGSLSLHLPMQSRSSQGLSSIFHQDTCQPEQHPPPSSLNRKRKRREFITPDQILRSNPMKRGGIWCQVPSAHHQAIKPVFVCASLPHSAQLPQSSFAFLPRLKFFWGGNYLGTFTWHPSPQKSKKITHRVSGGALGPLQLQHALTQSGLSLP